MAVKLELSKRALFQSLGYEPHEGQWAVHESMASRRVLACGVRWGKSLCAGMEAVAAALVPSERSFGWVCGPTYDLADKVFREVTYIVARHLQHRIVSLKDSERRIVLRNLGGGLSEIRAKSADNPVSLLGEGLDYLIVDEAARLRPHIWEGHPTAARSVTTPPRGPRSRAPGRSGVRRTDDRRAGGAPERGRLNRGDPAERCTNYSMTPHPPVRIAPCAVSTMVPSGTSVHVI